MSTTVRISDAAHARLVELAQETGQRLQTVLDEAIETYAANRFWEAFSAGYEQIAEDPEAWSEVQAERMGESPSLADDIEPGS